MRRVTAGRCDRVCFIASLFFYNRPSATIAVGVCVCALCVDNPVSCYSSADGGRAQKPVDVDPRTVGRLHALLACSSRSFRFTTCRDAKCCLCSSSQRTELVSALLWMQNSYWEHEVTGAHWASKCCLLCSRSVGVDHRDKGQGSQTNYSVPRSQASFLLHSSRRSGKYKNKRERVLMPRLYTWSTFIRPRGVRTWTAHYLDV